MKAPWFSIIEVIEINGRSVADIALEVCREAGISVKEFRGEARRDDLVDARKELIRRLAKERPDLSSIQIARYMRRESSTIRHHRRAIMAEAA